MMPVRDYMTSKVFMIHYDKKLIAVQEIMKWAHIRHVPVVDREKRLVGIISHRDLLHASISSMDPVSDPQWRLQLGTIALDQVMKTPVQTIGPDAPLQEAAKRMRQAKIGCLPVVEGGHVASVISECDLLGIVEAL